MKNVLLRDSFLFYGGNSLNFVQLIQHIRRDFHLKTEDLTLSNVVENHTVKSMSELISKLPGAETCINESGSIMQEISVVPNDDACQSFPDTKRLTYPLNASQRGIYFHTVSNKEKYHLYLEQIIYNINLEPSS